VGGICVLCVSVEGFARLKSPPGVIWELDAPIIGFGAHRK